MNDKTTQAATAEAAIGRLSGLSSDRIQVTINPSRLDSYEARAVDESLHVTASGPGAAVAGYAAFARRTGIAHVSRIGTRPVDRKLPEGVAVSATAQLHRRVAYNLTVAGYTSPYFRWAQWEAELDLLAASGINAAHITLGQELAYLETFSRYGYSEAEVLDWIGPPSHQPWLWLNSIQSCGEGTTRELVESRAALARRVMQRMRDLDITPILPGFSGCVPPGFDVRNPGAPVVDQGLWFMDFAGPKRPDWLDSTSDDYARIAETFYAVQRKAFDVSGLWAVDLLHEGGKAGGVDLGEAARGVQRAMTASDPSSTWVMQAWIGNPRREVLAGVDLSRVLILDLTGENYDADGGFLGAEWALGILPNYGGRATMYGDLATVAALPNRWAGVKGSDLVGLTNMAEGVDNNPVLWDLFSDLTWADHAIPVDEWLEEWIVARYGAANEHARAAWRTLLSTAYGAWRHSDVGATPEETRKAMEAASIDAADRTTDADFTGVFGGIDMTDPALNDFSQPYMSSDSVIAAVPSLNANQASMVGPRSLGYQEGGLVPALRELLAAAEHITTPGFTYDLADVARQVADDVARPALSSIRHAAAAHDIEGFDRCAERYLQLIDAQEAVAAASAHFLLGTWVEDARSWGHTADESAYLIREAKRLLTCWGGRDCAILIDYANRGWAGLIGDYYRGRWAIWLDQVRNVLTRKPTTPVDWYEIADQWVRSEREYPTKPQGSPTGAAANLLALADEILTANQQADAALPHA